MHNYVRKMMAMQAAGKLDTRQGSINNLTIQHDDWCEVYNGKWCNCDPNIILEKDVTEDQFLAHMAGSKHKA